MIVFWLCFTFVVFLCLFIASFSFLLCGSESPNVRFCFYFSLFLTVGALGCMFWVQETHPEFLKSSVSKMVDCSFKTSAKVI